MLFIENADDGLLGFLLATGLRFFLILVSQCCWNLGAQCAHGRPP
jgi:hypothetical protein